MARRTRKRRRPRPAQPSAQEQPKPEPAEAPVKRAKADDRPPSPWGSFPLMELMVLAGLLLLVAGLIVSGYRGTIMVGGGLALGALAGVELAVREHLAGYRSHSALLAGTVAMVTIGALYVVAPDLAPGGRVAAGASVFGLVLLWLRRVFKRRSGGASFRIGGLRG